MPLIPPPVKIPLPLIEAVKDFFGDLLGRGVALDKAQPALRVPNPGGDEFATKFCISVYHDRRGQLAAVTVAELKLAAAASAALVLTPATVLPEVEKAADFVEDLRANYAEIGNIVAGLLNQGHKGHLKFTGLYVLPEELPEGVWPLLDAPGGRRDWTLQVEGYASGRFSVLVR